MRTQLPMFQYGVFSQDSFLVLLLGFYSFWNDNKTIIKN